MSPFFAISQHNVPHPQPCTQNRNFMCQQLNLFILEDSKVSSLSVSRFYVSAALAPIQPGFRRKWCSAECDEWGSPCRLHHLSSHRFPHPPFLLALITPRLSPTSIFTWTSMLFSSTQCNLTCGLPMHSRPDKSRLIYPSVCINASITSAGNISPHSLISHSPLSLSLLLFSSLLLS